MVFLVINEIIKNSTKYQDGYIIKVKISANAKNNSHEFVDLEEYKLKLRISKPAVDGKANKEIVSYLSSNLNLPKNNIKIVKGEKSTIKSVFIKLWFLMI